ncbi:MAG: polysaccharide deacetylase family protein [Clostridia bacterium]|nr:polysaccharide deacetylase family protein [Clostridia bacterium]
MLKTVAKKAFLNALFLLPHNNIYSFHCICDDETERRLTGRSFDTQAFYSFVKQHGPYLPLDALCAEAALCGKAALTFDDGLRDVFDVAYPFLKKEGIPFTAFVLSGKLGQPGYLTAEQLQILADDPLVTIGSHGVSHAHLSRLDEETQKAELETSKAELEDLLRQPVKYFAYPFGDFNETTLRLIKGAGYEAAFAVEGRPLTRRGQGAPYRIPRLSIADNTLAFYSRS